MSEVDESVIAGKDRLQLNFLYLTELLANHLKIGRRYHDGIRKKFEAAFYERLLSAGTTVNPPALPVDRVRKISAVDFANSYLKKYKPVVLEGFCGSWPASKKWNFDYLLNNYGNIRIQVPNSSESVTLSSILESILNGSEPRYVNFLPLLFAASDMKSSVDYNEFKRIAGLPDKTIFVSKPYIGQKTYKCSVHNDISHNFLTQFQGEKTVTLFPLSQTPFLYSKAECPAPSTFSIRTRFDKGTLLDSEFEAFPLARFAQPFQTKLFPGDILFIPAFTWHQVYYDTPTIGLGNWWVDFKDNFRISPLFTLMSLPRYIEGYRMYRRDSFNTK